MTSQERLQRAISLATDPFSEPEVYYGEPDAGHRRRTFSAVSNSLASMTILGVIKRHLTTS